MQTLPSNEQALPQRELLLDHRRSSERLSYRNTEISIDLQDNRGREVHLSLSLESLSYQRSYDRFGVQARGLPNLGNSPRGQSEQASLSGLLEQAQAVNARHEQEFLDIQAERMELSVEGDVDLLQDAFSVGGTAQRIFDFVTGLGADIAPKTPAFAEMLDEITSGVQAGAEAASDLLGGLNDMAQDTIDLVMEMLGRYREDPSQQLDARALLAEREAAAKAGDDAES